MGRLYLNLRLVMAFEDYRTKTSVVVVFTGEGKGKTLRISYCLLRVARASTKPAN